MAHRAFCRMSRIIGIAVIALTSPGIAGLGQTEATNNPTFEAATLKPVPDGTAPVLTPRRSGDLFGWTSWLQLMLPYAYSIPATHIEGFKADGQIYSVTAKIASSATDDQVRQMLQALLIEKLKLVAHHETRETQGYALVIAKNGPKLTAADPSAPPPPMPEFLKEPVTSLAGRIIAVSVGNYGRGIVGRGVSMAQLADKLSDALKTPVADRTGLAGNYYFGFEFQDESSTSAPSLENMSDGSAAEASLYSVLPSKLGLRLEKAKVPTEFLVVEHSQPPANE